MSNVFSSKQRPRILFFGMPGTFSLPSLAAMLESDIEVCAVVLPATPIPGVEAAALRQYVQPAFARHALPIVNAPFHSSIAQLAWSRHIPVWEVYRLSDPVTFSTLAAYEPDLLCVACFSQRIPGSIITLPRLGSINVHPSLLPKNRGPVPLFWTFRNGDTTTGATIHVLNERMDSGDILAQKEIVVPDGISYAQLEAQCAELGGMLLAQTVWNVYEGKVIQYPQDEAQSSYHSFPNDQDFVVYTQEWDARHIYNFIRGVGHWDEAIQLHTDQGIFVVRDVISYSHKPIDESKTDNNADGNETTSKIIQCRLGTIVV